MSVETLISKHPTIGNCGVCRIDVQENKDTLTQRCHQCLQPFQDTQFFEGENHNIYCEFDYLLLHGSRCMRCGELINGKAISALDGKWHEEHFTCELCSRQLSGSQFVKKSGKPYCKDCNNKLRLLEQKVLDICERCKNPIAENKIVYKSQKVHAYHFTCTTCKQTLDKTCREHEERLYCAKDYERLMNQRSNCFGCRMPIEGRSIIALGKSFHPEHFVCTKCENPFASETFYEHDSKAYCQYHFNEITGDVCGHCFQPPTGDVGVVIALGRKWCNGHFTCCACHTLLSGAGKRFSEWDTKPLCTKCWSYLPLETRKTINDYLSIEKKVLEDTEKRLADEKKSKK